jgi:hypothetical protein
MADSADQSRGDANITRTRQEGWIPSRGFWMGMGAVAFFAASLATIGVIAGTANDTVAPQLEAPVGPVPTAVVSTAPRQTTPPDDFTTSDPSASDAVASSADHDSNVAALIAVVAADDVSVSSEVYEAPVVAPVASSWSQDPEFVPAAPAAELSSSAMALVRYANEEFGIEIKTSGQDWGATEIDQVANIGAVVSAWERLPASVRSAVADHRHGSLRILSNTQGRTSGGWQPYGDAMTSFYTNSDQSEAGYGPSHQIVLATGADVETALHEIFHAYEMRNVGADQYVAALLEEEMLSFMETSGWTLLVSQDELLASAHEPWETINGLFAYEGPDTAHGANPLEAFASAAATFYGNGSSEFGQPDLSAWLSANLS